MTYLFLLFYSFDIDELKLKIEGVEKLFIAGAIGTCFYLIYSILYNSIINTLILYISESYLAAISLPFSFNVFIPESHTAGSTFPEYLVIPLMLILCIYLIFVCLFYALAKLLWVCLDSNNKIFKKYRRFQTLKNYNFLRIVFFCIPYTFVSLVLIFLFVDFGYGFFQYLPTLHWIGRDVVNFLVAFTMLLIILVLLYVFIWNLLLDCSNQILPLIVDFEVKISRFLEYIDKEKIQIQTNLVRSFKKFEWYLIILIIIFIFFLFIQKIYFPVFCHPGFCTWSN